MNAATNPYHAYRERFPEESGYEYVMAPQLMGRPRFEELLRQAVASNQPLTQAQLSKEFKVGWNEGVRY